MNRSIKPFFFASLVMLSAWINVSLAQLSGEEVKAIEAAAPSQATVKPQKPRLLLVFNHSDGYKHSAIERLSKALDIMAQKTGAFQTVQTSVLSAFRPENLLKFDAVCFNNTTQLKFEDPVIRKSLLDFVAGGKGLIGVHAAVDNFPTWPEGLEMFGGVFDNHPWTSEGTWAVKNEDPAHPIVAAFGGKDFLIKDEIYRIKQFNLRDNARILLGLDMKSDRNRNVNGLRRTDRDMAICWVKAYGKGRVFYTSLGHNDALYANPSILRHYLDGIQFALGDYPVNTTPIPFDPMIFFDQDSLGAILQRISAYQYGDSRGAMADLNEFIRNVDDMSEARHRLEQQFLAFLGGNATLAGKQFICTRIALIGTEESLPVLTRMLSDSSSAEMALYAMQLIQGSKVDDALLAALPSFVGKTRVGIINALGSRRTAGAVPVLGTMARNSDSTLTTAVFSALGHIGSIPALGVLRDSRTNVNPEVKENLLNAMLLCAGHLLKEGGREAAMTVYQELNVNGEPASVRAAALRGLVSADPANAAALISSTLKGKDATLHRAVVQMVRELKGIENIRSIARTLPQLPPTGQVQLLASLSSFHDPELQKTVVEATASADAGVRVEALRTLGSMGDANVVPILAGAAASSKATEQKTARTSLYELNAPGVDDAIVALLPRVDAKVRVELIKALGERKEYKAASLFLYYARDPSDEVRLESVKALKVLAKPELLPSMIGLLIDSKIEAERRELEAGISAVSRQIPDTKTQDAAVLVAYPSVKNNAVRLSFINILGKIAAPSSLPVLRTALADKNAEVSLAAIRALSEWPTAEPYPDLWSIAKSSKDRTKRILALRGSVRLIGLDPNRSAELTTSMYRDAMKIAPDKNELKLLLSAVGEARSLAAFRLAASYLNDLSLRNEAEAAVVSIGEGIAGTAGGDIIPDLGSIAGSSKNDVLVRRANRIIQNYQRLEDYITSWEIAGPYTKEKVSLFAEQFAPETDDAASVEWKPFQSLTDPNRPWRLEFDKVIGGDFKVVYIRTNIWSQSVQKARMEVGSDDGNKIWINGELVHSKDVSRSVMPGEDVVPVTLKEGWNQVMMKVNQGSGEWGACARFRNPEGGKLEHVRISLNKN